jgi:hypothetical protein
MEGVVDRIGAEPVKSRALCQISKWAALPPEKRKDLYTYSSKSLGGNETRMVDLLLLGEGQRGQRDVDRAPH